MKDLTYHIDYGQSPRKEDFTEYFVHSADNPGLIKFLIGLPRLLIRNLVKG